MKTEAYVIEEKVLIVRDDEPEDVIGSSVGPSSSSEIQIREDDPRLVEELVTINPNADAFALLTTLSIC